ncbi:hypothetical protein G7054_g961 [Neopestalotiopsis clavispora]|nr:hypothetical protein G7054_g961 [Neopestalotiopsis clavispora]
MPDFQLSEIEMLPDLPDEGSISEGQYVVKATGDETVLTSEDEQTFSQIWFKSRPLQSDTIQRIKSIRLFAESHDQGFADDPNAGNWTWFELAILEGPTSKTPRSKDGVDLVWESHTNRFKTTEYEWKEGHSFGKYDDMMRLIEHGNVLAVRLCARYSGWQIYAKRGYLRIEIGEKRVDREPLNYGEAISDIKCINDAIQEINKSNNAAFLPLLPDTVFQAGVLGDGGPVRALALDGGGVRGLASLHMLKAVMEKAAPNKKPCEVFDMIGGTSTGGLIAIMLGRLEMTVDQCIDKYTDIMKDVFNKSEHEKNRDYAWDGEFYDANNLADKIKGVIKETLGTDHPEEVLMFNPGQSCRIFCTAVPRDRANNQPPIFLRSYKNPQKMSDLPNIKLWEAAWATSAAPAYFAPITVGGIELVDGGLQANNPLGWLWAELVGVFGPARVTDCFLSIGTGIGENVPIPKPGILGNHKVEIALSGIATNTEATHILFKSFLDYMAPKSERKKYWRLNIGTEIPEHLITKTSFFPSFLSRIFGKQEIEKVPGNFEPVGDLGDIVAVKDLVEKAKVYIKDQSSMIDECAQALSRNLR